MLRRTRIAVGFGLVCAACGGVAVDDDSAADATSDGAGVVNATGSPEGSADATPLASDAPTDVATADAGSMDSSVADASSDAAPDSADARMDLADAADAVAPADATLPPVDAGGDAVSDDGAPDGMFSPDAAPPDAGLTDADSFDPNPLAKCQVGMRDVYYVNYAWGGLYGISTRTYTNHDSSFQLFGTSPFSADVSRAAGYGDSISISLPDGGQLAPGSYAVGGPGEVALEIYEDGDGSGTPMGTLEVVDYTSALDDAGNPVPTSVLLAYSVTVPSGSQDGGVQPIEGCLRYATSPPFVPNDAGAVSLPDGGDAGAELLAPCAGGGNVFYVDAEGSFPGISGPSMITGAVGEWSGGVIPLLEVNVTGITEWSIQGQLSSSAPGTYTVTGNAQFAPEIQILANGAGCSTMPNGTFTIANLDAPNGADIAKLLMSFDLTCSGQGTLRGCVSFEP